MDDSKECTPQAHYGICNNDYICPCNISHMWCSDECGHEHWYADYFDPNPYNDGAWSWQNDNQCHCLWCREEQFV